MQKIPTLSEIAPLTTGKLSRFMPSTKSKHPKNYMITYNKVSVSSYYLLPIRSTTYGRYVVLCICDR